MSQHDCGCGASAATKGQFVFEVAANQPLCREHHRLVLRRESFPETRPGQFIQISCRNNNLSYSPQRELAWKAGEKLDMEGRELMMPLALLRRPFSIGGRRDSASGVELQIIYRSVGTGTRWLSQVAQGEELAVIGPLGNAFTPPADDGIALLVGGGVGIPPMLYLAAMLAGRKAVAFCGAVTRDLLPLTITADAPKPGSENDQPLYNIAEFAAHGVPAVISTDDGSYGFRGFVTQALERYLDRFCAGQEVRRKAVVYTCGPEAMMKRVADIATARNIACQISVERAMACGMGTCQSCVIKVAKPDPAQPPLAGRDWCYKLACTDGPVFKATDLLW